MGVVPHFKGDDLGWTSGELHLPRGSPVMLERYLADADDLRDDLNAFAAELETLDYSPHHTMLMEHVIQTKQLITLRRPVDSPDEVLLETLLDECCRFLAVESEGVYQIDGRGWFASDGERLIEEF